MSIAINGSIRCPLFCPGFDRIGNQCEESSEKQPSQSIDGTLHLGDVLLGLTELAGHVLATGRKVAVVDCRDDEDDKFAANKRALNV
jgi:hypothetical protein